MADRTTLAHRTVVQLRGIQYAVYSTEDFDEINDRIQVARDAVTSDMPAPLVATTAIVLNDDGDDTFQRCSFDPSLVAKVYSVCDEAGEAAP